MQKNKIMIPENLANTIQVKTDQINQEQRLKRIYSQEDKELKA